MLECWRCLAALVERRRELEAFRQRLQGRAEALSSEALALPWAFPASSPVAEVPRLALLAELDLASEARPPPAACPGLPYQEQERQEQAQSLAPAFLVLSLVVFPQAPQVLEPQVLSEEPFLPVHLA